MNNFFGEQFYPTPVDLANKMLDKVDFTDVQMVLEPSAGKGDLANVVGSRLGKKKPCQVECVEIDADLRAVLKNRGLVVVGEDFLQFNSPQRYDLVVMNPPFKQGARHLLQATKLMKNGGQIVCLLNAETVQNPYTDERQDLINQLDELNANIEMVEKAFTLAERKTAVQTAIVYINIQKVSSRDVVINLMGDNFLNDSQRGGKESTNNEIAGGDALSLMVKQYELSCAAGLEIIDRFTIMEKYLPQTKSPLLALDVISQDSEELPRAVRLVRQLRYEFWKMFFQADKVSALLTREVRESYNAKLTELRNYDFNISNIKQIQIDLSMHMVGDTEKAILKMFDDLTYQNSMEKSSNTHYYNGWKTNKAFAVNKKVIVPVWYIYDNRWGVSWSLWKGDGFLIELEKIFTYLDPVKKDGAGINEARRQLDTNKYAGELVSYKYFDVSYKKKGSMHIYFTDLDLLKKFNIFGANKKGWLPPTYGKKPYGDMTQEEKEVVKSFEGEREYQKTVAAPLYFLGGPELQLLEAYGGKY